MIMKRLATLLLLMFAFANADTEASETCQKLTAEGWCFFPPLPKSKQAAYGNYDRRTTWWHGYWINDNLKECSGKVPRYIEKQDIVVGDGEDCRVLRSRYRNGGYVPLAELEA
jgi:hypothetical protein